VANQRAQLTSDGAQPESPSHKVNCDHTNADEHAREPMNPALNQTRPHRPRIFQHQLSRVNSVMCRRIFGHNTLGRRISQSCPEDFRASRSRNQFLRGKHCQFRQRSRRLGEPFTRDRLYGGAPDRNVPQVVTMMNNSDRLSDFTGKIRDPVEMGREASLSRLSR